MKDAPSRRAVLEALALGIPLRALLPFAGVVGTTACGSRREASVEPHGPGKALPYITPRNEFFQFTRGKLPGPEHAPSLLLQSGEQQVDVPWTQVVQWATAEFERTLICDGHGFAMTTLPPLRHGHVSVRWDWRFAPIGTARWQAIPVPELFERAGVPLVGPYVRAVARDEEDWFHPIDRVQDELLLAVGMNGEPLPHEHGAPGRLIASGDYGLASLKWVTSLRAGADARAARDYGFPMFHGAPVKPIAFATSPRGGTTVEGDSVVLNGVAYAGRETIQEVSVWLGDEVDAEHSSGVAAELLDPPKRFVWSRWTARVPLERGRNLVNVSCVDRSGRFSTVVPGDAPEEPDGWGGVHRLELTRGG